MANDERAKGSAEHPPPRGRRAGARARAGTVDDLRRLLVGPEQTRIEELEERTSPETLGSVLPEAIASSTKVRGEELAISLEPAVASAVRTVARRETHVFAEVLSPVIGTAVRKAVADAIRAMLERFDAVVERSMSLTSLRWRAEARRTGRPFSEIALLRTLVYRVEQVFLIHSESGLLLEHVTAEGVDEGSPDQVASMLSAIDAFAYDALRANGTFAHLAQMQFGDLTCWVERGPSVTLAAIVRGVATSDVLDTLRTVQERIHLTHRDALEAFQSDVAPFVAARADLETCLQAARRKPSRRGSVALAVAVLLLFVALGLVLDRRARAADSFARHVDALRGAPGIVVTSATRADGHYRIAGLRDPLAADPARILARRGARDVELRFEPYHSGDPEIAEARIARSLSPPPGVELRLREGTLRATGTAPRSWIERASASTLLAGVERFDASDLHEAEALAAARGDAEALERIELPFPSGVSKLGAAQTKALEDAASLSARLTAAAERANMKACIVIRGYTDPEGEEEDNRALSEARAREAADALHARGVDPDRTRVEGVGVRSGLESEVEARRRGRSVTFAVELRPSNRPTSCGPA